MAEDTEIEIKIPLDENTFFKIKEKLKDITKFVKNLKQIDEYFTPNFLNLLKLLKLILKQTKEVILIY